MPLSPMMKVNVGWAVCIVIGIGSFVIAKQGVIKNRQEMMMARRKLDEKIKAEKEMEALEKNNKDNRSGL